MIEDGAASNYDQNMSDFCDFQSFWPFYISQHANRVCRLLHIYGTLAGLVVAVYAVLTGQWGKLALAPVIGYGFAWVGHFVFEKNRPATFRYPRFSFIGDFKLLKLYLTGELNDELDRLGIRS
jgi:hypothetical protein